MTTLFALLALLSLTLVDPPGDAAGDGTLVPPTSPMYANVAMFDLQGVELQISEIGQAELRVTLGSLGPAASADADAAALETEEDEEAAERARELAATQFDVSGLLAVVDVYLSTGADGASQTLRGPDMLLPTGHGWRYAVRLSAEGAWGVTYVGDTLEDAPAQADAELPTLTYVPLNIERSGNQLSFVLPWQFEPNASVGVFAVTGVHDPFSPDGWRGIGSAPSPWAFSGGQQVAPVIDVLALTAEAQAAALRTGVLPAPSGGGSSLPLSPWLLLMVGGVVVAGLGLLLRGRVSAPQVAVAGDAATDAPEEPASDEAATADEEIDVLATLLPFESDDGDSADETEPVAAEPHVEIRIGQAQPESSEVALAAPDTVPDDGSGISAHDTGEQLVEIGDPDEPQVVPVNQSASGVVRDSRAFSTSVEESYLDLEAKGSGDFGDGEEESFWHPRTRESTAKLKKTLIDRVIAAGEDGTGESGG